MHQPDQPVLLDPVLLDPFTGLPLRYPSWHRLAGVTLQPLGYRRNGDPIWPTLGGADDDEDEDEDAGGEDDQDDDAGGEDDQDDDEEEPEGADKLGDPGKKALASIKASRQKARDARDAAVKERDAAKAELAKLKGGKAGGGKDNQVDPEEIRRQAREEAATEAGQKANVRIVRAELKAAAAGRLEDPADAVAFIKAEDFDVDEDGEVDTDELAAAIEDLLERKPHLAKRNTGDGKGRTPKPDKSQGPRGKTDLDSRIAAARKAGDGKLMIQLENEKLRRPAKQTATPK